MVVPRLIARIVIYENGMTVYTVKYGASEYEHMNLYHDQYLGLETSGKPQKEQSLHMGNGTR